MTGWRWAVSDFEAQMSGRRRAGFFLSESGWKLGGVASSKDPCEVHDPGTTTAGGRELAKAAGPTRGEFLRGSQ